MRTSTTTITDMSGVELSQNIHARSVSCREVMQACLAQVERLNPQFNAIVSRVEILFTGPPPPPT